MRNLNYKLLCILLLMICGVQVEAQISGAATASPNSNSIPKFQTGVNMFTGAATIGMPLMTVSSDNVTIPISLNYTATQGVPVGMIASNVGLGWNLSAGGVITREVKDKPDDVNRFYENSFVGYLYNTSRIINLFQNAPPYSDRDWDDLRENKFDTEPDIFHFSFGNYSGTFVFDHNGKPKLFSKQDIKIEYDRSTGFLANTYPFSSARTPSNTTGYINKFKITTPDGSQYIFDKKEITASNQFIQSGLLTSTNCFGITDEYETEFLDESYSQVISWHLTSVVGPLGKEEVVINYQPEVTLDHSASMHSRAKTNECGNSLHAQSVSFLNLNLGWRIQDIQFKRGGAFNADGFIEFVYTSNREDLYNAHIGQPASMYPKALSAIIWKKGNSNFKKYEFNSSYFLSGTQCSRDFMVAHNKRLKLNGIKVSGVNDQGNYKEAPPIIFGYDESTLLPARHSYSKDYWGYSNGQNTPFAYPKFYYYPQDSENNETYNSAMSIYPRSNFVGSEVIFGENMMPDEGFMKAGILQNITYSSGVVETFDYEANKALIEGQEILAGGLRIKSIASSLSPTREYKYNLNDGSSSGRLMNMPQFGLDKKFCSNDNNYAGNVEIRSISRNDFNLDKIVVAYSQIEEVISGFGSNITYFDIFADVTTNEAFCENGDCIYKEPTFHHTSPIRITTYDRKFYSAPNPNMIWLQSLPVRKTTKTESGQLISEIVNVYSVFNYDKIKTFQTHRVPSNTASIRALAKYYYLSGDARLTESTQTTYGLSGNSISKTTHYEYENDAYRSPTKIYFVNDDGKEYGVEYKFVNEIVINSPYVSRDAALNQCNVNNNNCYRDCEFECSHEQYPQEEFHCLQDCEELCDEDYDECIGQIEDDFQAALSSLTQEQQTAAWLDYTCRGWLPSETRKIAAGSIVGGIKYEYALNVTGCLDCPIVKKTYSWEDDRWYIDENVHSVTDYGRPLNVDTRDIYDTRYEYDAAGMLRYTRIGDGTANGDFVTENTYNNLNQLEMQISADGLKSRLLYDGLGQVVQSEKRFSGDDPNVRVNKTYDLYNNSVETSTWLSDVPFVPDEVEQFDPLGRQTMSTSIGYTPQGNDYVTSTSYDPLSRPLSQCEPTSGGCTTYRYEPGSLVSRETVITPPNWPRDIVTRTFISSDISLPDYPGASFIKSLTIDENGNQSAIYSDIAGNKVLSRQYRTNASPVDVRYVYDGQGRLQAVTQPEGQTFDYTYLRVPPDNSGFEGGWLTTKSIPGGETITTQKDNRGLVLRTSDNKYTTTYEYDAYGREVKSFVGLNNNGQGQLATETKYYESGIGIKGKVKWIKHAVLKENDISGDMLTTSYTYDEFGRSLGTTEESLIGIDSYVIDPADIDHSDFIKISTHSHIGLESVSTITTNGRDHVGRTIGTDFSINGVEKRVGTYHYDEADRLMMKNLGGASEETSLEDVPYRYNGRGWIINIGQVGTCVGGPVQGPDFPDDPEEPGPLGGLGTITTDLIELTFNQTALCNYDETNKSETGTALQMVYKIQEENPATGDVFLDFVDTTIIELGEVEMKDELLGDIFSVSSEYRSCISLCPGSPDDMLKTIMNGINTEVPCLPSSNLEALYQIEIAVNNALAKLPSCEDCVETKGLFEEVINYTETLDFDHTSEVDAPGQYNGNISNVRYKVKWRKGQAEYGFAYDELNRLLHGRYREAKDPGTYSHPDDKYVNKEMYDVDFTYSDNGNLETVQRNGYRRGIWPNQEKYPEPIDVLDLSYADNQLTSSIDNATGGKHRGFNDPGGYTYKNGKLISEGGKGVESILYNFLNKPYKIEKSDGSSINIVYDASGRELRRYIQPVSRTGDLLQPIESDFAGGIEYRNGSLLNVPHPEGRYYEENGGYLWEYTLSDHLGNGRVWFTDRNNDGKISTRPADREINQEIHYYPYGMKMDGQWRSSNLEPNNQYQYNGIDHIDDLQLDVNLAFYRTLDPATGNWWSVDPKAEFTVGMGTYCAMGGNPISRADPDGDIFFIPQIGLGSGGLSLGLEVGIGVPGYLSASITGGYNFGAQKPYGSIQGGAFGAYAGYGTSGFFAGYGYQYGGFSGGVSYGKGGFSAGISYGQSVGNRNGSLGISYGGDGFGYHMGVSNTYEVTPNSDFQLNYRIRQIAKESRSNVDNLYAYQEVIPIPLIIFAVPALKALGAAVIAGITYKVYVDVVVPEVIAYYKRVSGNKEANEAARDWGYEDAHDLKKDHDVGSEYDIYRDGKTGQGQLRPKKGKPGEHKEIYPKYW